MIPRHDIMLAAGAPGDAPDEPEHRRNCRSCGAFLPRAWGYEPVPEEFAVDWYATCSRCGTVNVETRR